MTDTTLPPNWSHIAKNLYLVRTQAGFRQAIKHFGGNDSEFELRGYPRQYPSVVAFHTAYNGGGFNLVANCIPLNVVKDAVVAA